MALKRRFTLVIERDADGYYVASVPELPGCHTQARDLATLKKRAREAIELYLEVQERPAGGRFVGVRKIEVAVG
ncbi:MAG: type II toxin-antitoxin system HicB family antitoxin [Euryarchaeota archaeon]|nr:type II toxin-antitoxin system HicB family antitoxin [Euryarchaeota archaeon]